MTAPADGLQQKLSTLSNATVAGQICTCLQELKTTNPVLSDRLTALLQQLSDAKAGAASFPQATTKREAAGAH